MTLLTIWYLKSMCEKVSKYDDFGHCKATNMFLSRTPGSITGTPGHSFLMTCVFSTEFLIFGTEGLVVSWSSSFFYGNFSQLWIMFIFTCYWFNSVMINLYWFIFLILFLLDFRYRISYNKWKIKFRFNLVGMLISWCFYSKWQMKNLVSIWCFSWHVCCSVLQFFLFYNMTEGYLCVIWSSDIKIALNLPNRKYFSSYAWMLNVFKWYDILGSLSQFLFLCLVLKTFW